MSEPLDHDEDALRAAFASGVPTPPGAPDRASGARRLARRARRRRTAGVLVAVVAVVATVSAAPLVLDSDKSAPAPAAPTPSVSPAPVPADCPSWDEETAEQGSQRVGPDVVAVRLCAGPGDRSYAPAGVLRGDEMAAVVEQVNSLEPLPEGTPCISNLGASYRIFFDHADGTTQVARTDLYGCGVVTLGGKEYRGAQTLIDAVRAAVDAQQPPAVTCPTSPVDPPTTGPGEVAAGAVVVRLCQGPGLRFQAPLDQLSSARVATLAALVNDSTAMAPPKACNGDGGHGYALLFGYPDGSTQTVTGEPYGCHVLRVGDTVRTDPERVLELFLQSLEDQRDQVDERDVPNPQVSLDCPGRDDDVSLLDRTGGRAVLCLSPGPGGDRPTRAMRLDDDQNVTLLHDLQRTGVPDRPTEDCGQKPAMDLVIANQWGDRFVVHSYCGSWRLRGRYIKPSKLSQTRIDRLVARATSGG